MCELPIKPVDKPVVAGDFKESIQDYLWPGNIRELENMVESALITARGNKMRLQLPTMFAPASNDFKSLEEMERNFILQALKAKKLEGPGCRQCGFSPGDAS